VADGAFGHAVLSREERQAFGGLLRQLGPGEASCIACAADRGGTVATDDRAARACCAEREVACTGTIGILKACCREQLVTPEEADALLAQMVRHGFYSPIRRIRDVL